ncbi:MAG: Translation elongation factor [Oscillospiraceae bacterium]|nr:Translation elongation factor [Oscillospiraceae bacterium]
MSYSVQNIRNVCLVGHGGNGKTSLVESLLFMLGITDRQGKTADGNTVCDFDPEEVKRQISISMAIAPLEYNGCRINLLDCPGYFDFTGEVMEAMRVVESGILVCSAKDGVTVGTERSWKYLNQHKLPRCVYVSKLDEENGDFNAVFAALRQAFGKVIAPLIIPIWDSGKKVTGLVDVLHQRAYAMQNGKSVEIPVPEDKIPVVSELYDALKESVAETSEEFMEKYFSGEDFTYSEMVQGLKAGVRELSLVPVLCGSATSGMGNLALLNAVIDLFPNPVEAASQLGEDSEANPVEFVVSPGAAPCAFAFKTQSDQYGKYSFLKVLSGTLTPDMQLINATTGISEKLGRLYHVRGKKTEEVKELTCGDIGAAAKLEKVKTGDTLCDPRKIVKLSGIRFPEPNFSMAVLPKVKGQEDKIAAGLTRLSEEDPTFRVINNQETHQMVLVGVGDMQLDVLSSRLKSRFGVEVQTDTPRVAYREKIRKKVKVQGRHKKQSGGHGQFGDVWIEFEPGEQEELEFRESVFGGAVPKNYFPAVEKGLRDSISHGILAGYPMVYLKATLVDGSYHPVDSSEMAFKTAAQLAYKAGLAQASPILLEPIGALTVTIPDSYTGDVMGDLNKRRGRVMGMSPNEEGEQVIEAEVPMAEMMAYAIDLRSLTQSRGTFTFRFARYEEAAPAAQEKAVAAAKAMHEELE